MTLVKDAGVYDWDHVEWYVGNAKQTAAHLVLTMGFTYIAYRGLETGSRNIATHVVQNGNVTFAFTSQLHGMADLRDSTATEKERQEVSMIQDHLAAHGESVKNIALQVTDVDASWTRAVASGAVSVQNPQVLEDSDGQVKIATVKTFGNIFHSFIDRSRFSGAFLPGFQARNQPSLSRLPPVNLQSLDHIVGNQIWDGAEEANKFYEDCLGFKRFWSIDDTQACTEFSALRSTVVTSMSEKVKMSIIEPAHGLKKSSVQEFLDFNSGMPGVGHIAMRTSSIIQTVDSMIERGVPFMTISPTYYTQLRAKLKDSALKISIDLAEIERLNILVDYDEEGYLLQIFALPFSDRPTTFFEIIQRENFEGFGAGNFKNLFEALERTQALRGNLV